MADIKNFGIAGVGSAVQYGKGGGSLKWDTDGFVSTSDGTTLADLDAAGVNFTGLSGTGAVTVTNILDEDNMASDSATALATQQSIKAYVDSQTSASTLGGTGDSGAFSVNLATDTFGVFGGTNLTSTGSGSNVSVALDADISLTSVTATGAIEGGSLTDGTATLASGSLTGGVNATFSGTVTGGTLTDGTASLNSGALTGATNITASGAVQFGTLTDGTVTVNGFETSLAGTANTVPTSDAVKAYVDSQVGATTLTGTGDSGAFSVDLDQDTFGVLGGTNLTSTGSGSNVIVALDADINLTSVTATGIVQGSTLTDGTASINNGSITGAVDGTFSGGVSAANVTATSDLTLSGFTVDGIIDDDTMASASATTLATSESVKAYVDSQEHGDSLSIQGDSGTGTVTLSTQTLDVAGGTGMTSAASGQTITMNLDDTGVTAGDYGSATQIPTFTVNAQGQLTAASNVSIQTSWTLTGDSGSEVVNGGDTVTVAGGTNITTAVTATDTVTVNLDADISLTSVTATGAVEGGSLTDGTATLASGSLTGGVNGTFSGTVTGGTLTDGTATITAGDLTTTGTVDAGTVEFDNLSGTGAVTVTDIIDDDTMATASATTLATSESVKAYVDSSTGAIDVLSTSGDTGTGTVNLSNQVLDISGGLNLTSVAANQSVEIAMDTTLNSMTAATFSGQVSAGTLTDGSATLNSGSLSATSVTATGAIQFGSLTDGTVSITAILDQDDMASDSATALATQQSIKAYVDSSITGSGVAMNVQGDTGSGTIVFATDTLDIAGTANEIETSFDSGTDTMTIGLPDDVTIGNLTVSGSFTSDDITSSSITIDGDMSVTGDTVMQGNLTVNGTTTVINSNTVASGDAIIVLNSDLPSGQAPSADMGLAMNRGSSANVEMLWLETVDYFVFRDENDTLQEVRAGTFNGTTLTDGTATLTGGDLSTTGDVTFGTLTDGGESISITKFVDEADGLANNDNDTTIPTSAAVIDYVTNNGGDGNLIRNGSVATGASTVTIGTAPNIAGRTYYVEKVVINVTVGFSGNSVDHIIVSENGGLGSQIVTSADADVLNTGTYIVESDGATTLTAGQTIVLGFRDSGNNLVAPTAGACSVAIYYAWV